MDNEHIDEFVDFFELVLARPLMYLGKYDDHAIYLLIYGFHMALSITNHTFPNREIYAEIYKSRNWHFNALGAVADMRKQGLSDEKIVKELIEIEIEAWKTLRDGLSK